MTRWLEPFIDYGPDYIRNTPFYDATIVLGCRARELFSRRGVSQPDISEQADSVSAFSATAHALTYDKN